MLFEAKRNKPYHDHQMAIAQAFDCVWIVHNASFQAHDPNNVLNFLIFGNLVMASFSNIQRLSFERKHSWEVETRHFKITAECQDNKWRPGKDTPAHRSSRDQRCSIRWPQGFLQNPPQWLSEYTCGFVLNQPCLHRPTWKCHGHSWPLCPPFRFYGSWSLPKQALGQQSQLSLKQEPVEAHIESFDCWAYFEGWCAGSNNGQFDIGGTFKNFSGRMAVEPNALLWVVNASFVWESNAGFSIRQRTKTHRNCLMADFFTFWPFLFLLLITFSKLLQTWSEVSRCFSKVVSPRNFQAIKHW